MDQSSARLEEFPERGLSWAKEQFETVLSQTEDYVREKPAKSLLYAFIVGYIFKSAADWSNRGRSASASRSRFEASHFALRRHKIVSGDAGRRNVNR